ncbi:DUF732 domain-containing protein [[Mycobacterium] zoologicum]|uniref:DUF732 domain-containing protein n=1 Tax=[Mycobacterium] zoologicum TaxID=2872311 RepID=UPI002BC8669F|nr:DUF732 domain-containing protein [Mycolicibacter sp. MYC101]MEB3061968.1 DUF732 domain-containing protein [Mycolicibacter sp. MYC101]
MRQHYSVFRRLLAQVLGVWAGLSGVVIVALAPAVLADPDPGTTDQPDKVWAYQWNTSMGHFNFVSPGEALSYGYGICNKVSQGEPYGQLVADVQSDVTPSEGAMYLITQAVNELCPALIPKLRSSAVHYRG